MIATSSTIQPLRRWLLSLGSVLLILLVLAYVLYQARLIITGPSITLSEVPETVQNERTVILTGEARNIAAITLNGRTIYTDERGTFEEAVVLENGYTIATLEATDRYGRTTRVEQPFVYTPLTRLP